MDSNQFTILCLSVSLSLCLCLCLCHCLSLSLSLSLSPPSTSPSLYLTTQLVSRLVTRQPAPGLYIDSSRNQGSVRHSLLHRLPCSAPRLSLVASLVGQSAAAEGLLRYGEVHFPRDHRRNMDSSSSSSIP